MKVRVLNKFKDLKEGVIRDPKDKSTNTFECTEERYAEIMAVKTQDGKDLIKEVKPRKSKAKAKAKVEDAIADETKPLEIYECTAGTDK